MADENNVRTKSMRTLHVHTLYIDNIVLLICSPYSRGSPNATNVVVVVLLVVSPKG